MDFYFIGGGGSTFIQFSPKVAWDPELCRDLWDPVTGEQVADLAKKV